MAPPTRVRPSLFDVVFALLVVAIPIGLDQRLLSSDGDLARHLRLGTWMLEHRALLRLDNFSFTKGGEPFLPFEWGSEVLYAAAHAAGGLAAVAVLAGLLLALTYALLVRFLVRQGVDPLLAYLATMVSALLGASHWLARPHLFTMLFVIVLLPMLEDARPRTRRWCLPLFAVWANLHGGFSYGLVLIGLYLAGDLLELGLSDDPVRWRTRARYHAEVLALAAIGVGFNANGMRLLTHVAEFFQQGLIIQATQEFQSPDFQGVNGKIFLVVVLAAVTGLAFARRRPSAPMLLIFLADVWFAMHSQRNIELFALTALPLLVIHLDPEWRRLPGLSRPRKAFEQEYEAGYRGLPAAIFAAEMIVLAGFGGRIGHWQLIANSFDAKEFPAAAVARARAAQLQGRLYTEFTWGGYLLYAWPEQRVFIDGGTDHYGEKILGEYIRVTTLDPGWRDVLAKWNISIALLDSKSRLLPELQREPGWRTWYADSGATILVRGDSLAVLAR
jgi:hypothetical protein